MYTWNNEIYLSRYVLGILRELDNDISKFGFPQYICEVPPPGVILSFAYLQGNNGPTALLRKAEPLLRSVNKAGGITMLDSGAFTGYMRGKFTNIKEYIGFIKNYNELFNTIINLDVIGNLSQTDDNFKILEDSGACGSSYLMPVYHIGGGLERFNNLNTQFKWLGVGGIARKSALVRQRFLSTLDFNKVHLFGVADRTIIEDFRPYSFDSAGWSYMAGLGTIMFGDLRLHVTRGKDNKIPKDVIAAVSERALAYGLTYEELRTEGAARRIFNYFESMQSFRRVPDSRAPTTRAMF